MFSSIRALLVILFVVFIPAHCYATTFETSGKLNLPFLRLDSYFDALFEGPAQAQVAVVGETNDLHTFSGDVSFTALSQPTVFTAVDINGNSIESEVASSFATLNFDDVTIDGFSNGPSLIGGIGDGTWGIEQAGYGIFDVVIFASAGAYGGTTDSKAAGDFHVISSLTTDVTGQLWQEIVTWITIDECRDSVTCIPDTERTSDIHLFIPVALDPVAVPEPGSMALLLAASLGIGLSRKRHRNTTKALPHGLSS